MIETGSSPICASLRGSRSLSASWASLRISARATAMPLIVSSSVSGLVENQIVGQMIQSASRVLKEAVRFDETGVTRLQL